MKQGRRFLVIGVVAVAAAVAGYGVNIWRRAGSQAEAAGAVMSARLTDLHGKALSIDQWRGRVLVVNFWATWCAPCRDEIPIFIKLQQKHQARGLQFIGVAIDQREKVERFARDFAMNYPVLLGGIDMMELSRRAGNRLGALPFTIIMDRTGAIVSVQVGVLKEAKLEAMLQTLL
jgi:thiol-disulfide isomerase/thioredoxin